MTVQTSTEHGITAEDVAAMAIDPTKPMKVVKVEQVAPEVKVGDFFVCSWGYDQTNIDFYKVVSRTAKSVKIQKWQSKIVSTSGYQDQVVPGDAPRTGFDHSAVTPEMDYWERKAAVIEKPVTPVTKRLRAGYSNGSSSWRAAAASLNMNSYSNAYHWDGAAASQTGYGFGH